MSVAPCINIIQWNCNGYYRHYEELRLLIAQYDPIVLSIQETHTRIGQSLTMRGYDVFLKDSIRGVRANGGVALLVRSHVHAREVQLRTDFQAVAVRILPMSITVCSVYVPPDESLDIDGFNRLCDQLPGPIILCGDFNAHSFLWGCSSVTAKGRVLERLINDRNLSLLNDGSLTHFSAAHSSFSAIDLTLASPSLFPRLVWRTHGDLCSSDHYPIVISEIGRSLQCRVNSRWLLARANWPLFGRLSVVSGYDNGGDPLRDLDVFVKRVLSAADIAIPRSGTRLRRPAVPWWSSEISDAISERKKAL